MIASAAPDLDGVSLLFGQNAYWNYHHVLGHNLLVSALVTLALATFSRHRVIAAATYLAMFHLHLLMDYFGSGPGWGISYFWPFSNWQAKTNHGWEFYSWQNLTTAGLFIVWTFLLIRLRKRTPLEAIMPNLDRQIVALMSRRHLEG